MNHIKKDMPHTNISINIKTKDKMKKLGSFGDSYDKIINRLIDEHERNKR